MSALPPKRTLAAAVGMSALCQKRTFSSLTPPQEISTYWSGFKLDLKRFYLNLAEFDRASAVLQRDWPFIEHAVAQLCRHLAIENDSNVAAVRRYFVCIPFAGGFWHRINFDVSGDRTGAVTWIRALV